MNHRGFHYLLAFVSFIAALGLACSALTSVPTPTPEPAMPPTPLPPTAAPVVTEAPSTATGDTIATAPSGGELVTFTDQNKYFEIDVPADWKYTSSSSENTYSDTFTSPDGGAVIESIVYDDGTSWSGKDSGKAALYLLNQYYSKTGSEGDIRISEEKLQDDGSDRLTWTSKKGKYSGISFFEVRNDTAFLMFTVDWGDGVKDQYIDTLDAVVASYRVP